ncbi:MAG: GNAT family N-acetyltransferase [Candidatus Aenigmarchaeota archaeon]|nr:GNAT family N-acetyltransferase [Candidatus Aenigmarchaeota archaeon]
MKRVNCRYTFFDNLDGTGIMPGRPYLEKVSRLIASTLQYANHYGTYAPAELAAIADAHGPEQLAERMQNAYLALYEEDNRLLACGCMDLKDDGGIVKLLHVAEERQGQGIGGWLLDLFEEKVRYLDGRRIYAVTLNFPHAVRFYEERGYEVAGPEKYQIGNVKLPALLLKKDLASKENSEAGLAA